MKKLKQSDFSDHWYHEFRVSALPVIEEICASLSFAEQANNLISVHGANSNSKSVINERASIRRCLESAHEKLNEMEACLSIMP